MEWNFEEFTKISKSSTATQENVDKATQEDASPLTWLEIANKCLEIYVQQIKVWYLSVQFEIQAKFDRKVPCVPIHI